MRNSWVKKEICLCACGYMYVFVLIQMCELILHGCLTASVVNCRYYYYWRIWTFWLFKDVETSNTSLAETLLVTLPYLLSFVALFFNVLSHDLQLCQSEVYEKSKRGDSSLMMPLKRPLLVSGDICIELFNKPKMMKKVKQPSSSANVLRFT